jgi:hypothetical protein
VQRWLRAQRCQHRVHIHVPRELARLQIRAEHLGARHADGRRGHGRKCALDQRGQGVAEAVEARGVELHPLDVDGDTRIHPIERPLQRRQDHRLEQLADPRAERGRFHARRRFDAQAQSADAMDPLLYGEASFAARSR